MTQHLSDNDQRAIGRLSTVITFPTIATYPEPADPDAFTNFLGFVESEYPELFSTATVRRDPPWSLILEVPGTDPGLKPVLLLGHYDVVPVESGTENDWEHPPFGGHVDDTFIWGRGSLDDKASVIAILEAAERWISSGSPPRRGLVLAFGGDEEVTGRNGAAKTAALLREQKRDFHFILDEGSAVVTGMQADVPPPLALVGLAEKGYVDIALTATSTGGHAAMPPKSTALGMLAKAVTRIEARRFAVKRLSSIESFFRGIAGVAVGFNRFVYRFPRLLWPIIARVLDSRATTASLIRTTQAVTMAEGSAAANVLPQQATMVINVRIMAGETVESVLSHYRKLLRKLPVEVGIFSEDDAKGPPPETPVSHPGYVAVESAMRAASPEILTVPFIVTSSTDSKHYVGLSDGIIRIVPMVLRLEDLDMVHGTNERQTIESFAGMIRFYSKLLEEVCWHG